MKNKCECGLKAKLAGDGCSICNTAYMIECMNTHEEVAQDIELWVGAAATGIAEGVYQPLLEIIKVLNLKIERLERKMSAT